MTVQVLVNQLVEHGWLETAPEQPYEFYIGPDPYQEVIESIVFVPSDGNFPTFYGNILSLYVDNLGSAADPNSSVIPDRNIQSIQVDTEITILESLFLYGLPRGGRVLPILESRLIDAVQCRSWLPYIAYYDDGRTIIRAVVERPILLNLWTTKVEFVYPLNGDFGDLKYASEQIGRFEPMDSERYSCLR